MCPTVSGEIPSAPGTMAAPVPLPRSFKRSMKPRPARKASASSRINLNRFWNELEEFYNRYDDRRARNHNMDLIGGMTSLPAYTTDTFDHQREAAENELNERLEAAAGSAAVKCSCRGSQQLMPMPPRDLPANDDVITKAKGRNLNYSLDSEVDSSFGSLTASDNEDSEEDDEVFFTSPASPVPRPPPRTLLDLIQRMSFRD